MAGCKTFAWVLLCNMSGLLGCCMLVALALRLVARSLQGCFYDKWVDARVLLSGCYGVVGSYNAM